MRRVLIAALLIPGSAYADDPRDVFGLEPKPAPEPLVDCSASGPEARSPKPEALFSCVQPGDPLEADAPPYALASWLPARSLLRLPVADATHDQVAHYAMGAARDEAGPSFAGATGLENRWTIDGAPADGVRTGGADTRVPLVFLDGLYVTAGGFAAHDRTSTGGTIDARLRRGGAKSELETYAWLSWTADERQHPILPATYYTRRGSAHAGPDATVALVATGPLGALLGGTGWYAAGLAPSLAATDFTWTATRITDTDQDGVPDGLPGIVATEPIAIDRRSTLSWSIPTMARVGLDRGPHHVELSLVGTVSHDTRELYNATLQAAGVDRLNVVGDAIATWRGTWHDTHARVQAAWHRSQHSDSARDPAAANKPQLLSAYVPDPLPEDPAIGSACSDMGTDPYPKVPNCPVPVGWFASGGAGELVDATGDRPSLTADVAHRTGNHVLRAGATGEDTRLVTTSRFTGGALIRSLFPEHMAVRQFFDPNTACPTDPTLPCPYSDHSTLTYRTRYTAAYAEDTWQAARDVRFDGGLRWELMWVGPALHFSNELAPRLGVSWDPLGGGRSRVWTSMGRSFAMLPAGLGQTILRRDRVVDDVTSPFGASRIVDPGSPIVVAPGVQPITQDEVTAGAQVALAQAVRATMWVQGRWLRRGLETTPDGLDNPGRAGGESALRSTGLVAAELATAPSAKLTVRAGYMYQQTLGTWAGPYDPRGGATLYAGDDFDTTTINMAGALPTSFGHRTYIEAERRGQLGSVKLALAMRLTAGSGRPRNALADSDEGIIYLLPRGGAGTGPLLTQANVRLAASWRGFDATLDIFNLFDHRDATNLDEVYATGSVYPIVGGTREDLVFLRGADGAPAARSRSFDVATAYQSPLSVALGVRHVF